MFFRTSDPVINTTRHPIEQRVYVGYCHNALRSRGALVMADFLNPNALAILQEEAESLRPLAYYCDSTHNAYLRHPDPDLPAEHPRNLELVSDKGCVPHDQIPLDSPLQYLYRLEEFKIFLQKVLGTRIYPFADPLASINYNYYDKGQQLNWHFDNAAFAVTLMIQAPEQGGNFEYVENLRDSESGKDNYAGVGEVLNGVTKPKALNMPDGALVLFHGRNSLHRVAPVLSDKGRILVTLNYNTEPDVRLPDLTQMDFYGRTG